MSVHQFVPRLEPGAVGQHTVEAQRALHARGIESLIFAETMAPAMEKHARVYTDYGRRVRADAGDVLIYQMAIGSPVAAFVRDRPERRVLDYHNITPPEFFARWEPDLVHGLAWGRHQLAELAGVCESALADSTFNAHELDALGYPSTTVVPILLNFDAFEHVVDADVFARLQNDKAAGGSDLLFVGRIAPNKAQHDLVKLLAAYRKVYDPRARLRLVGGSSSDRYVSAIREYAAALGLADVVDMAGAVSPGGLAAYYRAADVFVSASEHEGFCVPVLEAMQHGVPVVAYAAGAVPETLEDAGVLLPSKAPGRFAAAVARVMNDTTLQDSLRAKGELRVAHFSLARNRTRFVEAVERLLQGAPA